MKVFFLSLTDFDKYSVESRPHCKHPLLFLDQLLKMLHFESFRGRVDNWRFSITVHFLILNLPYNSKDFTTFWSKSNFIRMHNLKFVLVNFTLFFWLMRLLFRLLLLIFCILGLNQWHYHLNILSLKILSLNFFQTFHHNQSLVIKGQFQLI